MDSFEESVQHLFLAKDLFDFFGTHERLATLELSTRPTNTPFDTYPNGEAIMAASRLWMEKDSIGSKL